MVFVLDKRKRPLMPCSEKRARLLLHRGRAVVHRVRPFTIRLRDRTIATSVVQPVVLKIDPGAQTTGLAVVREEQTEMGFRHHALHLAELQHQGMLIHDKMLRRAQVRRSRRSRTTRYRQPRFANRCRPEGWLAPSLRSRVDNVLSWADRYRRWAPIVRVDVERARFDTQKLRSPDISGVEYQQGTLLGYELREWLLEKWNRRCAYCHAAQVPLQIEHIVPRSRRGTDHVSNFTLACAPCNTTKGTRTAAEFGHPEVQTEAQTPLRNVAAVNSTRVAIGDGLRAQGFTVTDWTGGRTKWNRTRLGFPKTHAMDALCVGDIAAAGCFPMPVLGIRAKGRGTRCRTNWTAQGFPRGYKMRRKMAWGFQTGDVVCAVVPTGKHAGTHVGRVAVRTSGKFRVVDRDGIDWRHCRLVQRADGYEYMLQSVWRALPTAQSQDVHAIGVEWLRRS